MTYRRALAFVLAGVLLLGSLSFPAADAQEGELLIWVDYELAETMEQLAPRFEKDTGIGVTVKVYDDRWPLYEDFLAVAREEGAPDIVALSDDWIYQTHADYLAPLELGDQAGYFVPFALRAFTHDGQLYGLPYSMLNLALLRNTELVPEAPQTWGEVMSISAELRESGRAKHGLVMHDGESYFFLPVITAFGGYLFGINENGTYEPYDLGIATDGMMRAFRWLAVMTREGLLDTGLDWDAAHEAFINGEAGLIIAGPWDYWWFTDEGVPFAVDPLPAGTEAARPYVHVHGLQVNAHSDVIDAAQLFLRDYVATTETMQKISEFTTGYSPHEIVLSEAGPHHLPFAMAAANGQLFPPRELMDPVFWRLNEAFQVVREGGLPNLLGMAREIRAELP